MEDRIRRCQYEDKTMYHNNHQKAKINPKNPSHTEEDRHEKDMVCLKDDKYMNEMFKVGNKAKDANRIRINTIQR